MPTRNFLKLLIAGFFTVSACSLSGIEEPSYQSITKEGDFEIREYPDIEVAASPMGKMDERNTSFRNLFQFISGANQARQKISMTAPVIMEEGNDQQEGAMLFTMPAEIAKAGTPPSTNQQVRVTTFKGGKFAVLRFPSGNRAENRQQAVTDLKAKLKAAGITSTGQPIFAFYDPPFKPNSLSRFELWLRIDDSKNAEQH